MKIDTDKIIWRKVDDEETVVLDTESGNYYIFNEIATLILNSVADGLDVEKIVEIVVKQYDIGYNEAMGDVKSFLDNAVAEGIVQ